MYSRSWSRLYSESSVGRPAFVTELGLWDDRQIEAAEAVERALDDIDFVRVAFCDPHGLARSKTLTSAAFRTVLRNGMDFSPGPFIFDTGHAVAVDFLNSPGVGVDEILGAGDFVVVPDPLTFQPLPGSEPRTAWVLGDEYLRDGTPHPLSTRNVLRQVCARYAARELAPVIGLEVEWYLTRRLDGPPGNVGNGFGTQGAAPRVEPVNAGYQFNLDSYTEAVAPVVYPLAMRVQEMGLPLRSLEHESGPGQLETTFDPMLAMDAADAMLLFRTFVKQDLARQGFHASFMSLPRIDGFDPSGWHLHQSVMDTRTGRNLFAVAGSDEMSPDGKAYIEGLLARARDFCLLSVPTVNGYRRLDPAFTLAPTRIGWTYEDRTAMLRVLGGGSSTHIENRVGEPCANPYLLIAAQLFAGLDGLSGSPRDERGSGGDTLPQSLRESLTVFRAGRATELLGAPLAACLAKLKESEATRFEAWQAAEAPPAGVVTEWEQREYFENY
ncbi:glutamine synthetase family protein [Actinophytocola sp.]|uniref:glutamine synthetase family protein n=1 Tax=Actinophytocola sp. TaxID=1872138 RepID=UPI002D7E88B9|nr:glutamine synthetase family protein [Actinophytocola sp.]HET9142292.1 glutamine synthetase family protein [Actinophytocola sp.]